MTLQEAIDALPDTPDGIAEFMRERGITGKCARASQCVMAQYLANTTGHSASVSDEKILIMSDGSIIERMKTPWHIAKFIERFDARKYPFLIAETTHV